jgi:hypothetical protein
MKPIVNKPTIKAIHKSQFTEWLTGFATNLRDILLTRIDLIKQQILMEGRRNKSEVKFNNRIDAGVSARAIRNRALG